MSRMHSPITVLCEPLQHPEGPAVLDNGDVVFVETWTGRIKAYRPGRGIVEYAVTHGGPNACAIGSDGCLYATQIGGVWRNWRAERPATPGIQRIYPDGRVETIIDKVEGIACVAPNDLCFGADGRLYFTDPGLWIGSPDHGPTYVFAVGPQGKGEVIAQMGEVFPNGITAEYQGDGVVWGETKSRLIKRWRPGTPIEILATLPQGHMADGLKFDDTGRLWIATVLGGGFDVLDPETGAMEFVPCPHFPLNCVFKGDALIVTDRGLWDDSTGDVPRNGRLTEFKPGVSGPPLLRGRLS
jgi:gluconolactonase